MSMNNMFNGCKSLTTVPLYNTLNTTDVDLMFDGCINVESGSLALYQQMSSQVIVPERHSGCFSNCGNNTVTGRAELRQIPTSWGGTMS
jgi:hypothetical protein